MSLALLLSLSLAAAQERGDPGPPPPDRPTVETPLGAGDWRFAGLPLAAYSSDVGLTLGAALFFYESRPGKPKQQRSFNVSVSYATRGPRALDAGAVWPGLVGPIGLSLNLHLADDSRMPYWGEGAQLGGLGVPAGSGTPPLPYRYHDRRIFTSLILRGPIAGPLGWHLRARFLEVDVAEPSALLAASAPPGTGGGRVALGEIGLYLDTRDTPLGTHRGIFATAAGFAAPAWSGVSDFAFHGWNAAVRVYVPLWAGATLALRGLYDRKLAGALGEEGPSAAVPFFERMLYEGLGFDEGLGGGATIRGIARFRVAGDEKMLASAGLRVQLFTLHPGGRSLEFGVEAGVDAGRATQPGYPAVEGAGAALGLRLLWDRAVLLRVQAARAREGDSTLYVSFGEQF